MRKGIGYELGPNCVKGEEGSLCKKARLRQLRKGRRLSSYDDNDKVQNNIGYDWDCETGRRVGRNLWEQGMNGAGGVGGETFQVGMVEREEESSRTDPTSLHNIAR